MLEAKGFSRPDSSNKYKMHKSSGGTYSKPEARVKIIPVEEITYARSGKLYGKTVGSAGSQKRHCRRSVTPPPSSRKVSLVRSTAVNQKPKPPVSPAASCISPNWRERAQNVHSPATSSSCISPNWHEAVENGHSPVGGYTTNFFTTQIASFSQRPSPVCRAVLSQPSTAPKNLSRSDSTEAFVKSCSSRALHCRGQSSTMPSSPSSGLQKVAEENPTSSSSAHVLAAHSAAVPPGTSAEPSANSFRALGNEKLVAMSYNLHQGTKTAVASAVQKKLNMEPALASTKSALSEKSIEAYPDTTSRPSSSANLFDAKCKVATLQCEKIIPPSPQSISTAQCVESSDNFEAVPSAKRHISTEKQTNQESPINCNVSSGTPVILHTKLHKKHYQPEACWKGKFEVAGELTHICDGLEAHFPFEISVQVYEASKLMPETLKLKARPLSRLWPEAFKMKPPDGQDIGLCFISSSQRPNGNSDHLLEKISSRVGLRTKIGATKLLIFSSKLLTQEYQRKCGKFYFWGVFRKLRRSNQTCKSAGSDLVSDTPPGFTEAHCLPHTGETAEPHIDSSHNFSLDTPPESPLGIPPGFTEADRLPTLSTAEDVVSEKKPIKFALNVPRVAKTEVPPVFTKLLAVKQEPGLPAVYKATEKITSIGKVDEIKSKQDEVTSEQDESSEERMFPKTRLLSDILGSSASSNTNADRNINRNCTAQFLGKFEGMVAPENQTQGTKRDHRESPEPSAADTYKRLKVNGRIALNKVMDRPTLNSPLRSREGSVDVLVSGPSPTVLTREAAAATDII
uniref:AIPP2-like SPOC-like domain-containing protein n=1 Tax=Leersia perrieri TaxID=77586 RepID=A0A0D9VR65_9ORYZ